MMIGDGLVDGGVGGQVVVLALELAIEPARTVANRLDNSVLGIDRGDRGDRGGELKRVLQALRLAPGAWRTASASNLKWSRD